LLNNMNFILKPTESIQFVLDINNDFVQISNINFSGNYDDLMNKPDCALKSTPQKTIITDTTLDNSYNGCLVKVKATAIITYPVGLITGFNCIYSTYTGSTATLSSAPFVTKNSPSGFILLPNKMCTSYQDGADNYEFRGELSV
jgi:hypothetical protein